MDSRDMIRYAFIYACKQERINWTACEAPGRHQDLLICKRDWGNGGHAPKEDHLKRDEDDSNPMSCASSTCSLEDAHVLF